MPTPNTATFSFAGVDLPVWDSNQIEWVGTRIPLPEFSPFDNAEYYWSDAQHLNLPSPRKYPEVEPGVLRWPVGAARWAAFHFVVNTAKLESIRSATGTATTGVLTIADGRSGKSITTTLYMMPARPLAGGPTINAEPYWVVSLVDERFWWWYKAITIETRPASWSALFDDLAAALGVSLTGDTAVESAYSAPTERWLVNHMPANAVLDAAAESVGRRVVRRLDGTVRLERPETAWGLDDGQYTTQWVPSTLSAASSLIGTVRAGGRIASGDIGRTVPGQVRTVFGRKSGGVVAAGQHGITWTLPTVVSGTVLSGTEFSGQTGLSALTARFTADAYALWSGAVSGNPTNLSTLTALARQSAADWYGWRRGFLDVSFAGIVPWIPTGLDDQVRWSFMEADVSTRVTREPWFNWNVYGYYPNPVTGVGGGVDVQIGVLDGTMTFGNSATVSIWSLSGSVDADTGVNEVAYDWLLLNGQTVPAGKHVVIAYAGGRWRVIGAQCG